MKRQQLLNGPAMIRDASGHGRGGPALHGSEARMWGAEIIDRTNKVHPMLQRAQMTRQSAPPSRQRREVFAEGRVQPLNIGRVDHAVSLRLAPQFPHACWRAINNTPFNLDHPSPLVALHNL